MEHTKRKLEVSGKLPYIFATTAPSYRLSGAVIVSYGAETGGQDWPAITNEEREANAKELVRRWNAFEKDGVVDELRTACEETQKLFAFIAENYKSAPHFPAAERLVEAAIAKVKA